jgi:hypothetical protein
MGNEEMTWGDSIAAKVIALEARREKLGVDGNG